MIVHNYMVTNVTHFFQAPPLAHAQQAIEAMATRVSVAHALNGGSDCQAMVK